MSQPEVWMDNYETGHKSILKTDFLILCKRRPTTYKLEYKICTQYTEIVLFPWTGSL